MSFLDTIMPLSSIDESGKTYWYASNLIKISKAGRLKRFRTMFINPVLRHLSGKEREELSKHFSDTTRFSVNGNSAKDIKISEHGLLLILGRIEKHVDACNAGDKGEWVTKKRRTNLPLLRPQTNNPSPIDIVGSWHRKSIGALFGGRSIKTIARDLRKELFREASSLFKEKYGREKHRIIAELLRASDKDKDGCLQKPKRQAQRFSKRQERIGVAELFLDGSISERFGHQQKGTSLEMAYLFHAILIDRACKWERRGAVFLSAAYLSEAMLLVGVIGGIAAMSNTGRNSTKPKKEAKETARALWNRYKIDGTIYKNKTAFIEDILQKDLGVTSEKTVRRWIEEFEGKKKAVKGLKVSSNLVVWDGH